MVGARSFFRKLCVSEPRGRPRIPPVEPRASSATRAGYEGSAFRNYLNISPVRKSVTTQFFFFHAGAGPGRLVRPRRRYLGLGLSAWLKAT